PGAPGLAAALPAPRHFAAVAASWAATGTLGIFALMALVVADVAGRNLLGRPITGVAEIAARAVVAVVFLQLPAAALAGRLTRSDILSRAAPGLGRALDAVFALVGASVFAAIAWAAWPEALRAAATGDFFGVRGVFTIPTLPFWIVSLAGAGMTAVAYALRAFCQPGARP
ncbi:MAG: TRAP transporter small permease subunit, partial [Rubrimonas sp.]